MLILPLLGATITGLLMYYVVGGPVSSALVSISGWLKSMQGSSAIVLGMILGCMMAFDMGGPVNKAAYTFGTGLLAIRFTNRWAAIMSAGMTPPLGIALATMLFRNRFSDDEREAGKAAAALGISFITEGAIPFAAKDPFRVIPSIMLGSSVAGAVSMAVGAQLHAARRHLRVAHAQCRIGPVRLYDCHCCRCHRYRRSALPAETAGKRQRF